MPARSKRYHLSTEHLLRRMVMQENRARIAAWVGLALEPYRDRILTMHKKRDCNDFTLKPMS